MLYELTVDGVAYTTDNVTSITIRDRLNQLPRFDFRAFSLDDTAQTHFRAGATVTISLNGTKRLEGMIERFDHQESSMYWDCTGYGVGRYLDHRRSDVPTLFPVGLQGENTVKDIVTYVVNTACGYPTTGNASWTVVGESGPDLLFYKVENQTAMDHLSQLVTLADMDWRCDMATATSGYVLTLGDVSTTHAATNLKIGRDIIKADVVTDMSKVSNNIVIQSKDYYGNTIISNIGDYTNVCELASSETYLREAATAGATVLYVLDHQDFPASGSVFLSASVIDYTAKSTASDTGHPFLSGLTCAASHGTYAPVMYRDGFVIAGATAPFLDADAGTLKIGRETITYTSVTSLTATTAMVNGPLTRPNAYAHGREAPVFDTDYTLASPTSTTSVATFGRKDEVMSGLGYQDINSLDLAAYGMCKRKCGWPTWGQASIVGGDFPTLFASVPKVGDWVNIEEQNATTYTTFRITGLDYDQMAGSITINWGQNEEFALSDLKKADIAQNQAMS